MVTVSDTMEQLKGITPSSQSAALTPSMLKMLNLICRLLIFYTFLFDFFFKSV